MGVVFQSRVCGVRNAFCMMMENIFFLYIIIMMILVIVMIRYDIADEQASSVRTINSIQHEKDRTFQQGPFF